MLAVAIVVSVMVNVVVVMIVVFVSTKFHFDETIILAGLVSSLSSLMSHIYGNFATL